MAIQDFNVPKFFDDTLQLRLNNVYPELKPYLEQSYFIYGGLHPEYSILRRDPSNIIRQVDEVYNLGKRNIFFDCADEGYILEVVYNLHKVAEILKNKYQDIKCILILGSEYSENTYITWCNKLNLTPVLYVLSCYFFEFTSKTQWSTLSNLPTEYNITPKDKIYSCLNRVLRNHRIAFLDKMLAKNLVNDKCYYSFYDSNLEDGGLPHIEKHLANQYPNINENIDLVRTLRLNFDPDRINPADLRTEDYCLFQDSYFSVIPETIYNKVQFSDGTKEQAIFFSEKTYKPIVLLQPFILLAAEGSLALLRSRGFKTFHPFIDETYDIIENDDLRMEYIVNEVDRLSKQTKEQWLIWQQNIKPIVEHNFQNLKNQTCYVSNKDLINRL